jgi:hypothetical protein
LKRQIHADLELLRSQFNISISARINTALADSGVFLSLFRVISEEIWRMIKITVSYQILEYKTLELVIESESIFSSDYYDPTSIPESSNPVMTEEKIHSWAWEQLSYCISVQNVNVDEDDIQNVTDINMNKIEDVIDVKEIVKKWQMSVSFINRGMKHLYT